MKSDDFFDVIFKVIFVFGIAFGLVTLISKHLVFSVAVGIAAGIIMLFLTAKSFIENSTGVVRLLVFVSSGAIGVWLFLQGDQKGHDYNGYYIAIGWVFIAFALIAITSRNRSD